MSDEHVTNYLCEQIDSLRAQLADRDAEIQRLRTEAGLDSSQREDELRAALAQAQAEAGAMREELSLMVSYLAHQDQDADHAWMAEHMRKAALSSTAGRDLLERVRRLAKILREHQWSYRNTEGWDSCPECGALKGSREEHEPDCEIGAALREEEGKP